MLKKSLSEQIYEQLKFDIIHGKIKLGEKLTNKNLQERFMVSSSPIRDAINKLYFDGLLITVTRAGAQVVSLDEVTFQETNEVLSILNCAMLKKSYEIDLQKQIEILEECISLQIENINNDEYYMYDYKFHKTFFDFGNNQKCKELFKTYNALHDLLVRCYHDGINTKSNAIEGHKRIVQYLKENEVNLAIVEMDKHYKTAKLSE